MKKEIQQIDLELLSKVFLGEVESTKIDLQLNDYFLLGESLADDNKLNAAKSSSNRKMKDTQKQNLTLNLRFNSDGSLCCVFPKQSSSLENIFCGKQDDQSQLFELEIKLNHDPHFFQFIQNLPFDFFGVHFGNSKEHRHIVISLIADETPICFLKMAHNVQAEEELIHEKHMLSGLAFKQFKSFDCPSEFFLGDAKIEISSSVFRKQVKSEQEKFKLQQNYFLETLSKERKFERLEDSIFWNEIQNKLELLKSHQDFPLLKEFCKEIDAHAKLIFTFAHGDFAQEHCYYDEEKLLFFSLKHSNFHAPAFFDFIDLVFEKEKNNRVNLEAVIENYIDDFNLRTCVEDLCVDLKPYTKIFLLKKVIDLLCQETDKVNSIQLERILKHIQSFLPLKSNAA